MRVVVHAGGPDLTLRCPAIKNFQALVDYQGMILSTRLFGRKYLELK